jgi:hypothetical protein
VAPRHRQDHHGNRSNYCGEVFKKRFHALFFRYELRPRAPSDRLKFRDVPGHYEEHLVFLQDRMPRHDDDKLNVVSPLDSTESSRIVTRPEELSGPTNRKLGLWTFNPETSAASVV